MINKAKLALIAAVAAVSVVSPALAQSQVVSPPNTAVPPPLFVPQTGQTLQNLPPHRALARHHFRSVRNQAFGAWPWYGYDDEPPYTYDDSMTYPTPGTVVVRPEPQQVRCQHSEQTRTVPSANGGTTEVTISRCQNIRLQQRAGPLTPNEQVDGKVITICQIVETERQDLKVTDQKCFTSNFAVAFTNINPLNDLKSEGFQLLSAAQNVPSAARVAAGAFGFLIFSHAFPGKILADYAAAAECTP